jgi:Domain of unknown function (DUF3510)
LAVSSLPLISAITYHMRLANTAAFPSVPATLSCQTPLQLCLTQQQRCLTGTRVAVWGRVCSMLGGECKKGLSAVRAVAAKYRMTNKPAPDAPSPYVELILQPFKYVTQSPFTSPSSSPFLPPSSSSVRCLR